MTPIIRADIVMIKIHRLEYECDEIKKRKIALRFSKKLQTELSENLTVIDNLYRCLYEFYPEYKHIRNIYTFMELRRNGKIPDKQRSAVVGSKIITLPLN